jgi:hypothetical protein
MILPRLLILTASPASTQLRTLPKSRRNWQTVAVFMRNKHVILSLIWSLSAAILLAPAEYLVRLLLSNTLVKGVVAHHDRRGAATGEAFDKLDRELPVLGRLRPVDMRVQAKLRAKVLVQFVGTTERAAQRAADLEMELPDRLPLEHRVEGHQFVNVNRLEFELGGNPLDRLA